MKECLLHLIWRLKDNIELTKETFKNGIKIYDNIKTERKYFNNS